MSRLIMITPGCTGLYGYVRHRLQLSLFLCILGNLSNFISTADFFFSKIDVFLKFLQKYHQSVRQFGSPSGPNCLQML